MSEQTTEHDAGLTNYERGIVHQSIGAPIDVEYLDDFEEAEYRRGYNYAAPRVRKSMSEQTAGSVLGDTGVEIQKAEDDMLLFGTGWLMITRDGVKHVPAEDVAVRVRPALKEVRDV